MLLKEEGCFIFKKERHCYDAVTKLQWVDLWANLKKKNPEKKWRTSTQAHNNKLISKH